MSKTFVSKKIKQKKKSNISNNLVPNSLINRERNKLGLSRLDQFRYSISGFDTQWTLMATPAFSAVIPLTVIATGAGDDQRGTDPTPLIPKAIINLLLYQEVDLRVIYRIVGFTVHPRIVTTGATIVPLNFFTAAPVATTNFWTLPFLLERNQPYPFTVWHDSHFSIDTNTGCQSTEVFKKIAIPKAETEYVTSDATGATATNHQFLCILCDAPTDVYHTYDYSMNRIFYCDK